MFTCSSVSEVICFLGAKVREQIRTLSSVGMFWRKGKSSKTDIFNINLFEKKAW